MQSLSVEFEQVSEGLKDLVVEKEKMLLAANKREEVGFFSSFFDQCVRNLSKKLPLWNNRLRTIKVVMQK